MKYLIKYKCFTKEGDIFEGDMEVERETKPLSEDDDILCLARKDSTKFVKEGVASLSIKSITILN